MIAVLDMKEVLAHAIKGGKTIATLLPTHAKTIDALSTTARPLASVGGLRQQLDTPGLGAENLCYAVISLTDRDNGC